MFFKERRSSSLMDGTDQDQCSLVTLVARWARAHLGSWTGQGTLSKRQKQGPLAATCLGLGLIVQSFIYFFILSINSYFSHCVPGLRLDTEMDQTHPCPQGALRTHTKIRARASAVGLMLGVCSGPGEHEGEAGFPQGTGRPEELDSRSDILMVCSECLGFEHR